MRAESTSISWALACRTRSFIRIAGTGTQLDQVSGASDRVGDVVSCSDRTMVDLESPSASRSRKLDGGR